MPTNPTQPNLISVSRNVLILAVLGVVLSGISQDRGLMRTAHKELYNRGGGGCPMGQEER